MKRLLWLLIVGILAEDKSDAFTTDVIANKAMLPSPPAVPKSPAFLPVGTSTKSHVLLTSSPLATIVTSSRKISYRKTTKSAKSRASRPRPGIRTNSASRTTYLAIATAPTNATTPTKIATSTKSTIPTTLTKPAITTKAPIATTPTTASSSIRIPIAITSTKTTSSTEILFITTPTNTKTSTKTSIVTTPTKTTTSTNSRIVTTQIITKTSSKTPIINIPTKTSTKTLFVITPTKTTTSTKTPIVTTPTKTISYTSTTPSATPNKTAGPTRTHFVTPSSTTPKTNTQTIAGIRPTAETINRKTDSTSSFTEKPSINSYFAEYETTDTATSSTGFSVGTSFHTKEIVLVLTLLVAVALIVAGVILVIRKCKYDGRNVISSRKNTNHNETFSSKNATNRPSEVTVPPITTIYADMEMQPRPMPSSNTTYPSLQPASTAVDMGKNVIYADLIYPKKDQQKPKCADKITASLSHFYSQS